MVMQQATILIAGAGKIGALIAQLLAHSEQYQVILIDNEQRQLDAIQSHSKLTKLALDSQDQSELSKLIKQHRVDAVVVALPYFCHLPIAEVAYKQKIHYFDLTEDVHVVNQIRKMAHDADTAFVNRCGVAPGYINILALELMSQFKKLETVKLRAGCLPINVSNPLQYGFAWSIDGLINEYGNVCYGIVNGDTAELQPLDEVETVELDGVIYEAFNTSGGIASLVELSAGKVQTLNYKTLRYPGHCEKMRFLMQDLKLNSDRDTLRRILTNVLPQTDQDVMIVYVSVSGYIDGQLIERSEVKRFYPKTLFGKNWSAIQLSTANAACAIVSEVLLQEGVYSGVVKVEEFKHSAILANEFGRFFA